MVDGGSSTIWSRTSTSSSTSEAAVARPAALARLVHPFPSILDGLVVLAIAMLAGGEALTALRLSASMTSLQFAIGALNDIIDAPADAGHVPPKPIPAGLISKRSAGIVACVAGLVGLALAAPSGPGLLLLAVVVLGIGAAYDLVAKGTPWSWVPFAIGIPILPVYGWFGVTAAVPGFFAILVPMAVLAGAGLALANARVDAETDAAAGVDSAATRLGAERSWWANVALMASATLIGVVFVGSTVRPPLTVVLIAIGTTLVAFGLSASRGSPAHARRRGWEAQAIGAGIAAVGWISAMLPRA
jgi:4-hydroxybenzoate polyprenyltransferase